MHTDWNVRIPSSYLNGTEAFGSGNSTILFTAMSDSVYTAAGDNHFGAPVIYTLFNYKLRDLTAGVDLVEFKDGWEEDGSQINETNGSLTGNIIAGHKYVWTTYYVASKKDLGYSYGFQASGDASLNFSAVPEPSSIALVGIAGLGMCIRRRR